MIDVEGWVEILKQRRSKLSHSSNVHPIIVIGSVLPAAWMNSIAPLPCLARMILELRSENHLVPKLIAPLEFDVLSNATVMLSKSAKQSGI